MFHMVSRIRISTLNSDSEVAKVFNVFVFAGRKGKDFLNSPIVTVLSRKTITDCEYVYTLYRLDSFSILGSYLTSHYSPLME